MLGANVLGWLLSRAQRERQTASPTVGGVQSDSQAIRRRVLTAVRKRSLPELAEIIGHRIFATISRHTGIKKVFAIVSHKGGTGKTTSTGNIAGALSELGYRVLIVSNDAQGDVSGVFLDDHESLPASTADFFKDLPIPTEDAIRPTRFEGISIIPSDGRLNLVDKKHGFDSDPTAMALVDAITEVQDRFDYVLIDCAGEVNLTGFAAMAAANEVLVPVEPLEFSLRNLRSVRSQLTAVQRFNPVAKLRCFLSKVTTDETHEITRRVLVGSLGEDCVCHTAIPYSDTYKEAINLHKPIVFHEADSDEADIVRRLAMELILPVHISPPSPCPQITTVN
jgi:chromosome partitioning protein